MSAEDEDPIVPIGAPGKVARPIKRAIELSERKFDIDTEAADLRRVYRHLEHKFGEEYGLLFVFIVRVSGIALD